MHKGTRLDDSVGAQATENVSIRTCMHRIVFLKAILVDALVVTQHTAVDFHARWRCAMLRQHVCYTKTPEH